MVDDMTYPTNVTGVVLAGGRSRRLGRDKAVELVGGEPLISRVIGRMSEVANEIVVVVNGSERASQLPLPQNAMVVVDAYPDKGSLGGIFSGLKAGREDWAIVVACDMPFVNVALLRHILEQADECDAVVPILDGRPEPIHAAYSKACLPAIEKKILADDLKIAGFFDDVRVKYVAQDDVDRLDPDHLSFFNINTEQDLERAAELVSSGR